MKKKPGPKPTPKSQWKHGSSTYQNRGCRCPICTAANKNHVKAWRAREFATIREARETR